MEHDRLASSIDVLYINCQQKTGIDADRTLIIP